MLLLGEKHYVPNYQIKFVVRLKIVFLILDFFSCVELSCLNMSGALRASGPG